MTNNSEIITIFITKLSGTLMPYYGVGVAVIIFIAMTIHSINCLIKKRTSEALEGFTSGIQYFCTLYLASVVTYLKFYECDISSLIFPFNIPIWFLVLCIVISFFFNKKMVNTKKS